MNGMAASPSSHTLWLLMAAALLWFGNIQYRVLMEPDEARYAEISREMVATGDWTTPRLNDLKYFEKPPLQYWATAMAYRIFGVEQWTARLYSTTLGFLGVLVVYGLGRRLWKETAGLYASIVVTGSLLWVSVGHINLLDVGLTFWLTAALACFLIAQNDPTAVDRRRLWMIGSWAAIALAVLSKGPVALALPAFAIAVYSAVQRDFELWRRLHLGWGLTVVLAICSPWFVRVSMHNPEFAQFFFIHEHLARYLTKVHQRYEPWWYFIPILLIGSLPWTWAMVRGVIAGWRVDNRDRPFHPARFLIVWSACVFLFFSGSDSKLPPYILPMMPPLALLAGVHLTTLDAAGLRRAIMPTLLVTTALFVLTTVLGLHPPTEKIARYSAYVPWIAAATAALIAGVFGGLWLSYRSTPRTALIVWGLAVLAWGQLLVTGHNSLAGKRSTHSIAEAIEPHLTPETRLYSVGQYLQGVPFYLGRTVTLAIYTGELEMGAHSEPHKWLPTFQAFADAWNRPGPAIATVNPKLLDELKSSGLALKILLSDSRTVLITKP